MCSALASKGSAATACVYGDSKGAEEWESFAGREGPGHVLPAAGLERGPWDRSGEPAVPSLAGPEL